MAEDECDGGGARGGARGGNKTNLEVQVDGWRRVRNLPKSKCVQEVDTNR